MTRRFELQLTDEELARLVQSLPSADPRRDAACEVLVRRFDSMVRRCVSRYRDSPEPADDLTQVAYIGLLKAINKFDPAVGTSLAAYAQPCVIGELRRHFRDTRWHVHVRRSAQELRLAMQAAATELTQELARTPSDSELAGHLGVSETELAEAHRADHAFQALSLDAPLGQEGTSSNLGDLLGAEDPLLEHVIEMDAVWSYLAELPVREQRLLTLRFYGNLTQEQIAERFGISQMHVSRLLTRSLSYLRKRIKEPVAGPEPESATS